jgi:transcription antitermination factor NusG
VRTEADADRLAAQEIGLAGFEVFAPTELVPARRARRDAGGRVQPARPAHVAPLFRSYLFTRFSRAEPWQQILELPGVERILGPAPDMPTALPDTVIHAVRGLCSANGCLYPRGVSPAWNVLPAPPSVVGTVLRVTDGPLAGTEGLCEWTDGQLLRMLVGAFGRQCPVTVRRQWTEAA